MAYLTLPGRHATAHLEEQVLAKLVAITIVLQYVYHLTFNILPDGLRLMFASAMLVVFVAMSALAVLNRPTIWQKFMLLSLSLTVVAWTVGNTFGFGQFRLHNSALDLQLFFVAIWMLTFADKLPRKVLVWLASLSLVLGCAVAVLGEPIYYGGPNLTRPQPLTGGLIRVFPTAYFLAANLIILDLLRRQGIVKFKHAVPIMAIGLLAVVLYQVRTTWVILACYCLAFYGLSLNVRWLRGAALFILAAVFFTLAVFFGIMDFEAVTGSSVENWGSGRIAAFTDRTQLLLNREIAPFIFGTGPGSDSLPTGNWWGERSAHNDILSTQTERGLIGVIGLFAMVFALFGQVSGTQGRSILLIMIVASLISNGFFSGNSMAFYYLTAMAVAMAIPIDRPGRPGGARGPARGGSGKRSPQPSRGDAPRQPPGESAAQNEAG